MPPADELTPRERRVLEAVIQTYVQTAEPAGSRVLSRRFELGVSPATIRNTMSDLEEKGFLSHPHTSAGRVPTDKAYRAYVDALLNAPPAVVVGAEQTRLRDDIGSSSTAIEAILRRAAQSLGVLTQELGVALGPRLDASILRRLDLVRVGSEKLLLVLTLEGGVVRTVFVEVRGSLADTAIEEVTRVLNERLAGHTLRELRASVGERLRDSATRPEAEDLLNIFVQEGESLFDAALPMGDGSVIVGQASVLAEQPEFSGADSLRRLLSLTEEPARLADALRRKHEGDARPGVCITIGGEHGDPRLDQFTVVTAEYHAGPLAGVIGVIGPTRMPYDKVISLVQHTSRLLSDLL
ncbi:MAG: Heat-inducible transcription repressor hrcA [Gemmatimonadetes bacterium]|jgi:heat-inducible transcriptional repressor|nr:Heat-inducible transcription repressor hrcA [Gemmatimonadota bacterium]